MIELFRIGYLVLAIQLYPVSLMYTLTTNNSMNVNALMPKVQQLHAFNLVTWGLITGILFLKIPAYNSQNFGRIINGPRELARGHTTGISCKFVIIPEIKIIQVPQSSMGETKY